MMRRVSSAVLALALAGCMVGPDYRQPGVALPTSYPETLPDGMTTAGPEGVAVDWWTLFGDPTLNDLVRTALDNNRDIQLAIGRIQEANANVRAANSAFLPEIDATAGAARTAIPFASALGGPTVSNTLRLGLSTSFEIDFWGRLRRGMESANALAQAARSGADVVRLSTAGLTAQSYFAVRSLDSQIEATRATFTTRSQALDLVNKRAGAGVASGLDVSQAEAARADAAAQLKELTRQRAIAMHALQILVGRLDLTLEPADLLKVSQPALPPAGLPSALLGRRPDIRQAEQQLIAQNARIGVARAEMFPTISLTAAFGALSDALTGIVKVPNRNWSVGASLVGPIFDAGRREALTEAEEARTRQALTNYQQVIERSFREVADALVTVRQAADSEADQEQRARAANNALRLANLRYDAGYSAFLEVLDAQRVANDAQLALVRNRQTLLAAQVDLMRAMGGGWTPEFGLNAVAVAPAAVAPEARR